MSKKNLNAYLKKVRSEYVKGDCDSLAVLILNQMRWERFVADCGVIDGNIKAGTDESMDLAVSGLLIQRKKVESELPGKYESRAYRKLGKLEALISPWCAIKAEEIFVTVRDDLSKGTDDGLMAALVKLDHHWRRYFWFIDEAERMLMVRIYDGLLADIEKRLIKCNEGVLIGR